MRFLFLTLLGFFLVDIAAAGTVHPLGFQNPTGPIAEEVNGIYNFIFYITATIFVLVQGVLLYCIWRFRRSRNKTPATFTHNTLLEVVWLAIPAVICVVIAIESYKAMHFIRTMPEDGLEVEVIAYQFGWDFDYPELEISSPEPESFNTDISPVSKTGDVLTERYTKEMVVPVNTNVKLHITSKDVIHAFYVPELTVKIDAMPGRINYQWFNIPTPGTYVGQCAELCGAAHGEMYFVVKAVSQEAYKNWVNARRDENGLSVFDDKQLLAFQQ